MSLLKVLSFQEVVEQTVDEQLIFNSKAAEVKHKGSWRRLEHQQWQPNNFPMFS